MWFAAAKYGQSFWSFTVPWKRDHSRIGFTLEDMWTRRILKIIFTYLVCAHAHKPRGACEGQRTNCGSWFSPPPRGLSSSWWAWQQTYHLPGHFTSPREFIINSIFILAIGESNMLAGWKHIKKGWFLEKEGGHGWGTLAVGSRWTN